MKCLAAALVVSLAMPALAQQQGSPCAPREYMLQRLAGVYGEVLQAIMIATGNVVEIFANLETGTWSFVVTLPNGQSCLVGSGVAYENVDDDLGPKGEKM